MAPSTKDEVYAQRLDSGVWWKRWLDVQSIYRWNLRRLQLGFTLDLGCGTGRHLAHLPGGAVGVDHNPHSVAIARGRGLAAFTSEEFAASPYNTPDRFDAILLSHVAEHMTEDEAVALVRPFVPLLRAGGQVVLICPQEAGFRSDATHVQFMDFSALGRIAKALQLELVRQYSFPFPRAVGHVFPHNEFNLVCRKP